MSRLVRPADLELALLRAGLPAAVRPGGDEVLVVEVGGHAFEFSARARVRPTVLAAVDYADRVLRGHATGACPWCPTENPKG